MRGAFALVAVAALAVPAPAQLQSFISLERLNHCLAGHIVDHTKNHRHDNRLPSAVLCQKRDLYVYLPPGYDRHGTYPLLLWLHGAFGDEHSFLDTAQLEFLDRLIRCGQCPPLIVACPDLSCRGLNLVTAKHSFGINGCCGRFEDHLMHEVIPFVLSHYAVCSERKAHAVAGVSAGGFAAMNLALKHRDFFATVVTLSGALNLRYGTCSGDYFDDFCPETYRWRTCYRPNEVVGVFASGLVRIRAKTFLEPVFGSGPGIVERIARENPADLIFTTDLQPCDLVIRVSYGGKDELNFDAHGASFAWLAAQKGVAVTVDCDPEGTHGSDFFRAAMRRAYCWLAGQFSPDVRR